MKNINIRKVLLKPYQHNFISRTQIQSIYIVSIALTWYVK